MCGYDERRLELCMQEGGGNRSARKERKRKKA